MPLEDHLVGNLGHASPTPKTPFPLRRPLFVTSETRLRRRSIAAAQRFRAVLEGAAFVCLVRKLLLTAILAGLGMATAGCGSRTPAIANLEPTTTTSTATAARPDSGDRVDSSGVDGSNKGEGDQTGPGFSVAGTAPQMTKFAACMRANGEPNVPDPNAQGVISTGSLDRSSPQFEQALTACRKLLPNGSSSPAQQGRERRQAVEFSVCMRRHGVFGFPDPQSTAGGGMVIRLGPTIDPSSPQFRKAQQTCEKETHGGKS